MTDLLSNELAQRTEYHHGRTTTARPLGTNGLLFVLYSGDGPLPDYDIAGWEQDKPIGGGEVHRSKISLDYRHVADALSQMERELTATSVKRERGAISVIEDRATQKWALWLESWPDYFARSHILKSPESVAAEKAALQAQSDEALAHRIEQQRKEQVAYLAKPTTRIFIALIGLLVLWEIARLFLRLG